MNVFTLPLSSAALGPEVYQISKKIRNKSRKILSESKARPVRELDKLAAITEPFV
jgi:hypothetical protein